MKVHDVTVELPSGNLDKRVPAVVGVTWLDHEIYNYEALALVAQQRLADELLKLLHPIYADGRLRVSKLKLAKLFNKIGVVI